MLYTFVVIYTPHLMLLMFFQQGFCPRNVLGEIVGGDERADVAHPRHQVTVVSEEAVQGI